MEKIVEFVEYYLTCRVLVEVGDTQERYNHRSHSKRSKLQQSGVFICPEEYYKKNTSVVTVTHNIDPNELEDDFRELVYRPSKRNIPTLNNLESYSYDDSVVNTILSKISEEASLYSASQRSAKRSWSQRKQMTTPIEAE